MFCLFCFLLFFWAGGGSFCFVYFIFFAFFIFHLKPSRNLTESHNKTCFSENPNPRSINNVFAIFYLKLHKIQQKPYLIIKATHTSNRWQENVVIKWCLSNCTQNWNSMLLYSNNFALNMYNLTDDKIYFICMLN